MKKRIIAAALTLLALTSLLIGCGKTTESGTAETLKTENSEGLTVHLASNGSSSLIAIADKKGYFEEEFSAIGAEYTVDLFANGAEINTAMGSGDIDFGSMADQPAMAAVASGYGTEIIAQYGSTKTFNLLVARKDSGIKTVADLKGKKIALMMGTVQQYQLDVNLSQAGLTEDDVELVNTTDLATLLETGDVDAGSVTLINVKQLLDEGTVYKLTDGNDTGLSVIGLITARKEFAEKHEDATIAFLKAVQKAIDYKNSNPDDAYTLTADYFQIDKDIIETGEGAWDNYLEIKDENIKALQDELEYLQNLDIIQNKDITVSDMIVNDYWKQAIK